MASRRSRVKAVANLPVRRKPLTAQQTAEDSKLEDDASTETNVATAEKDQKIIRSENSAVTEEDSSEVVKTSELTSPSCPTPASSNASLVIEEVLEGAQATVDRSESSENASCGAEPTCNINPTVNPTVGTRFGRRLKPSVSLAALKERQQKVEQEKTDCTESNILKNKNLDVVKNSGNSSSDITINKNTVNAEHINEDCTDTSGSRLMHNDNPLFSQKEPEKLPADDLHQEKEIVDEKQSIVNVVDVTHQENIEKHLSLDLKLPVNISKQSVIVSDLNSNDKYAQESNTSQRNKLVFTNNKNPLDTSFSHSSSQITSMLTFSSSNSKRNSSTLKQKKLKLSDCTRKVADARREFQRKYENVQPDRSSLRMIDLIFYNPSTNPMESKSKYEKRELHHLEDQELLQEGKVDDPDPVDKSSDINTDDQTGNEDTSKMPVPQVKIGSNGEIILDEKSLVIETTDAKKGREDLQNSVPVFEDRGSKTCYYRRKTQKSRDWTDTETKRFYKALNTIGTDFSLMQKYFPIRTRLELKNKFKREEKLNRNLIDKALNNPSEYDVVQFEKYLAMEKQTEEKELKMRMQKKVRAKKPENRVRTTKSSMLARELIESDDDVTELQNQSNPHELAVRLMKKAKKSNEINLLCTKYSLKEIDNNHEKNNKTYSGAVVYEGCEHNKSNKISSSPLEEDAVNDLNDSDNIRRALGEILNNGLPNGDNSKALVVGTGKKSTIQSDEIRNDDSHSGKSDVLHEFYEAVVNLSESLQGGESKISETNHIDKHIKKSKRVRPNIKSEKRKLSTQTARKNVKKQKTHPFMSTLDIETYDSKFYDSNSSSSESNNNSVISTKTITDQDFLKLLAANAKNMKESKIQFQITEDYSSEKKVEIILDNVPSITLNEIQDQNVTIWAEYNSIAPGCTELSRDTSEECEPNLLLQNGSCHQQRQGISVIVKNPNAKSVKNQSGSTVNGDHKEFREILETDTVLKNIEDPVKDTNSTAVREYTGGANEKCFQTAESKGNPREEVVKENEIIENENVILVIDENEDGILKNYQYMMVEEQDLEVSAEVSNSESSERNENLEMEVSQAISTVDSKKDDACRTRLNNFDEKLPVENVSSGSFMLMSAQTQAPLKERKFNVFMISEESQSDNTGLLPSVPVIQPSGLVAKEL